MTVRKPRYSKEEFAQRGDKVYESQIRSQIDTGYTGFLSVPTAPLVGMSLLYGYDLRIQTVAGGIVTVEKL